MAEMVGGKVQQVLPNVWLGTSIENAEVGERVDHCVYPGGYTLYLVRATDWGGGFN